MAYIQVYVLFSVLSMVNASLCVRGLKSRYLEIRRVGGLFPHMGFVSKYGYPFFSAIVLLKNQPFPRGFLVVGSPHAH